MKQWPWLVASGQLSGCAAGCIMRPLHKGYDLQFDAANINEIADRANRKGGAPVGLVAEFVSPKQLYRPSEVLESIDDRTKGVYGWWFRHASVPRIVPLDGVREFAGMLLLYVGTGPTAKSKRFLRDRMKNHIDPDATRSTLRRTLGCLLAESLDLEFKVTRSNRRKQSGSIVLHFGLGDGELRLSDWMETNTQVSWVKCDLPWEQESDLIREVVLPLNLKDNDRQPFAKVLRGIRREHFGKARQEWENGHMKSRHNAVGKVRTHEAGCPTHSRCSNEWEFARDNTHKT